MDFNITTHELKTWTEYYQDVVKARKNFELRKDDRDYKVGDRLILIEWLPEKNCRTGFSTVRYIKYILKDAEQFGLAKGYVILGLQNEPVKLEPASYF